MEFKKLTAYEVKMINYYVILGDRSAAYKRAHPKLNKEWGERTIARKANEFFEDPRIQYYRGFKDGGIVVIDEDELMTAEEIAIDVDNIRAVGSTAIGSFPKYRPEFPKMMIDYFDVGPCKIERSVNEHTGEVSTETITSALPTKAGFAAKLRVSTSTLKNWTTVTNPDGALKYPEFAEAYEIVDAMTENVLVNNTLMGQYQPSFAQFYAKNKLGYRDKTDLVLEGGDKPIVSINASMTPEEAAIIYKEMLGQNDK